MVSVCVCHMLAIQRASWSAVRVCALPYGCQRASQTMPRVYTVPGSPVVMWIRVYMSVASVRDQPLVDSKTVYSRPQRPTM